MDHSHTIAVVLLLAACGGSAADTGVPTAPDPRFDAAELVVDTPNTDTSDTVIGADTGDTGEPFFYDCTTQPDAPFAARLIEGAIASEDLAFDDLGNLVGSNNTHIYQSTYQGDSTVMVPNFNFRAGIRDLPTGDIIVADNTRGELTLVNTAGQRTVVLSGLSYPNGIEVHRNGLVYVTEHNARRVRRVDVYTGDNQIIVDGTINSPNGLAFSPDYRYLYIDGFSGARIIYRQEMDPQTGIPINGRSVETFITNVGSGFLDGMAVDYCGNIYVCDYARTKIYRYDANGQNQQTVIDRSGTGDYLPNMQWGSGLGGWDPMKLYVPEGWSHVVREVDVGVPDKPRW